MIQLTQVQEVITCARCRCPENYIYDFWSNYVTCIWCEANMYTMFHPKKITDEDGYDKFKED